MTKKEAEATTAVRHAGMFDTVELGQRVSRKEFNAREPVLREQLLEAQARLRSASFPVIVVFAGVDGAGKGETANLLNEWLDPRGIVTRAYGNPSDEDRERPESWRFWRDLPPRGRIGVFLSAWYSEPLLRRVNRKSSEAGFDDELDRITAFEKSLVDDGALILKFWMHLGRAAQKRRFRSLERDPLTAWRVTERDWKHWRMYDKFVAASERLIMRTSTGDAPWDIVEGEDRCFRSLRFGTRLLEAIEHRLAEEEQAAAIDDPASRPAQRETDGPDTVPVLEPIKSRHILSSLDMDRRLSKKVYGARLAEHQATLNQLHRGMRQNKLSTILVFEGWDAAGKGGAIRRITAALDARDYQVISIGPPTEDERAHHYLWRFWRHLPRAGRVTIFDRSWYGRVLVERIEGLATKKAWQRAFSEINDFESRLVDHGITLVKFWVNITRDEQEKRFEAREQTPHKRWKLTEEDWRNREKWEFYEVSVNDMVERTSTRTSPWVLVEGNDKRFARVKVLETVCTSMKLALESDGPHGSKRRVES